MQRNDTKTSSFSSLIYFCNISITSELQQLEELQVSLIDVPLIPLGVNLFNNEDVQNPFNITMEKCLLNICIEEKNISLSCFVSVFVCLLFMLQS